MNLDQMHFFTVVAQMENVSKAAQIFRKSGKEDPYSYLWRTLQIVSMHGSVSEKISGSYV